MRRVPSGTEGVSHSRTSKEKGGIMTTALTAEQVREIRKTYKLELVNGKHKATNLIELSRRYNVSQDTIRKVAKKRIYAWVND